MKGTLIGAAVGFAVAVLLIEVPLLIAGNGRYEVGDAYLVMGFAGIAFGGIIGFVVGGVRASKRRSSD